MTRKEAYPENIGINIWDSFRIIQGSCLRIISGLEWDFYPLFASAEGMILLGDRSEAFGLYGKGRWLYGIMWGLYRGYNAGVYGL